MNTVALSKDQIKLLQIICKRGSKSKRDWCQYAYVRQCQVIWSDGHIAMTMPAPATGDGVITAQALDLAAVYAKGSKMPTLVNLDEKMEVTAPLGTILDHSKLTGPRSDKRNDDIGINLELIAPFLPVLGVATLDWHDHNAIVLVSPAMTLIVMGARIAK